MGMTVQKLISELRKMPPRAKVAFVDHDHDVANGEWNGPVSSVWEAPKALKDRGYGVVLS